MRFSLLLILLFTFQSFSAQVIKDLDGDLIKDTVTFNAEKGMIICKLSTQKFKPIRSQPDLTDEMQSGVQETKSGFEFIVNYMRAGFAHQFRYEPKDKKVRLIGMSMYNFGPASNDGSGEGSVNLLTNTYIGEWYHYDDPKSKLIKMPTIKSKMVFPKIYLDNYSGSYLNEFQKKSNALYYQYKKKM